MRFYVNLFLSLYLFVFCNLSTLAYYCEENEPGNTNNKQQIDSLFQNIHGIDFDYISLIQGVKHTISLNNYFFEHIEEIPLFTESTSNFTAGSLNNFPTLFHYVFQMHSSGAGGFGPPLAGLRQAGTIKNEADLERFVELAEIMIVQKNEWDKLPFLFRKGVVEFLLAAKESKSIFLQFAKPIWDYLENESTITTQEIFESLIVPWQQKELKDFSSIDIIDKADFKKLSFATRILIEKLNWFLSQKEIHLQQDFKGCTLVSSPGELFINGVENDTITGQPFCVLELGGDDVYTGNCASPVSRSQPLGIFVDFGGNDKYLCENNFLAAGILGIGALIDLSGDDYYLTNKPGMAFSLYGSSLLYDYSGTDVYRANAKYSQAAAYVGTSVLIDVYGDDIFDCLGHSQGFGGTLGVALFHNHFGDDQYNISDSEKPVFSQSFVQGAARGRWAEATDGQSLGGGIGIFIDNSGTDEFFAGSFSQGASYYFGLGLFSDGGGNDKYNAVSHSQGYAAHYSLAGFIDENGNDEYNLLTDKNRITQIMGSGRDFSAGFFIEREGDDIYHFGNRSAGIGDLNGIGVLLDCNGDDQYFWNINRVNSGAESLGKSIDLNQGMGSGLKLFAPRNKISFGIHIDTKGTNTIKELNGN